MIEQYENSWKYGFLKQSDTTYIELCQNPDLSCVRIQVAYAFLKQITEYYDFHTQSITLCDVALILHALDHFCPYQQHQLIQPLLAEYGVAESRDRYAQPLLFEKVQVTFMQPKPMPNTKKNGTQQVLLAVSLVAEAVADSVAVEDSRSEKLYQQTTAVLQQFTLNETTSAGVRDFYLKYIDRTTVSYYSAMTSKPQNQSIEVFIIERLQQLFTVAASKANKVLNIAAEASAIAEVTGDETSLREETTSENRRVLQ